MPAGRRLLGVERSPANELADVGGGSAVGSVVARHRRCGAGLLHFSSSPEVSACVDCHGSETPTGPAVCSRSGNTSILGSAAKRRHRAEAQTTAKNGSVVSQPLCVWVFSLGLVRFSFLVLDDAICVVGECEFLQCTVLGQHGAVSDDATLRGRDVIFS